MDEKRDVVSRASSHAPGSAHTGDGARARRRAAPPPQEWQSEERYRGYAGEGRGFGWLMFAGTMIAIVGIINFIYGIAAIDNSKFYVGNAQYILSGLNTWGWVIMFTGVLQFAAAIGIFMRSLWARWVGVATDRSLQLHSRLKEGLLVLVEQVRQRHLRRAPDDVDRRERAPISIAHRRGERADGWLVLLVLDRIAGEAHRDARGAARRAAELSEVCACELVDAQRAHRRESNVRRLRGERVAAPLAPLEQAGGGQRRHVAVRRRARATKHV